MSGNHKISFKAYPAWNYEKEIDDLNKASGEGWQLVKGGCFHSRFVKNDDIRYRYQLDYRKVEDMGRYIETFREQGWEYVNSTFNGWHYFRKLYDPSQPEEAYEIFTDRESLREMNGRLTRMALILGLILSAMAVFLVIMMIRKPRIPSLVLLLMVAVESVVLIRGAMIARNSGSGKSRGGENVLFAVFLAVIIAGVASNTVLLVLRPDFTAEQIAASIDEPVRDERWAGFEVKYPDNYYLDLELESEMPMTFKVINESGEAIYSVTDTDLSKENIRLRLEKGQYRFVLTAEKGFRVKAAVD